MKGLRRDLIHIDDVEVPKMLVAAGLQVSEPAAAQIASAIPSDSGTLSGTVRPGKVRTGAVVRVGTAAKPYAGWVEFGGTRPLQGPSERWPRPFIPTGRYIFPVAERLAPQAAETYSKAIGDLYDHYRWSNHD
jgi:hypothetical protein